MPSKDSESARFKVDVSAWITVERGPTPAPEEIAKAIVTQWQATVIHVSTSLPNNRFAGSRLVIQDAEATAVEI